MTNPQQDPFRRVIPGEPVAPGSANRANAITDAVKWVRDQQNSSSSRSAWSEIPVGQILVRNETGDTLPPGAVLGATGSVISPTDEPSRFKRVMAITGDTPTDEHLGRFVILAQEIQNDKVGRAYAFGVCPVQIEMVSEDHKFADVTIGDTTKLTSSDSGVATILSVEDGTGTKWALIRLGGGGGTSTPSKHPKCDVISDVDVPRVGSLVEILSYNEHGDFYLVGQPTVDSLSIARLLWTRLPLTAGVLTVDGGCLDFENAPLDTDKVIAKGDSLGSKGLSFKATKGMRGIECAAPISGSVAYAVAVYPGTHAVYSVAPTLRFSGGGATTQATAGVTLDSSGYLVIQMGHSGVGYTGQAVGTLTGGTLVSGGAATIRVVMVGGISDLALGSGGSGYTPNAINIAVTITAASGDPGTGATGWTANANGSGVIVSFNKGDGGVGYEAQPTIVIGTGGATATAVIE